MFNMKTKKLSTYYLCYKINATWFILKIGSSLSDYKISSYRRQFCSKLQMIAFQIIFNCSVIISRQKNGFTRNFQSLIKSDCSTVLGYYSVLSCQQSTFNLKCSRFLVPSSSGLVSPLSGITDSEHEDSRIRQNVSIVFIRLQNFILQKAVLFKVTDDRIPNNF